MAKILTFHPGEMRRDDSGCVSGATSAEASAEVIVFPGVRYERWDDGREARGEARSPLDGASKKRNGQERDVLELAE